MSKSSSGPELGIMICEALNLPTNYVKSLTIHCGSTGHAECSVSLVIPTETHGLIDAIKKYELREKKKEASNENPCQESAV